MKSKKPSPKKKNKRGSPAKKPRLLPGEKRSIARDVANALTDAQARALKRGKFHYLDTDQGQICLEIELAMVPAYITDVLFDWLDSLEQRLQYYAPFRRPTEMGGPIW